MQVDLRTVTAILPSVIKSSHPIAEPNPDEYRPVSMPRAEIFDAKIYQKKISQSEGVLQKVVGQVKIVKPKADEYRHISMPRK